MARGMARPAFAPGLRLMVRDGFYNGEVAYLATMHRKERAIAPVLGRELGIRVQVTAGLDTDQFGTFSRESTRQGSQLDRARAKISATFARSPHARLAIATEGSFGPHPDLPRVPLATEVIVLTDRHYDLEVIGRHVSSMTTYAQAIVTRMSEALDFAAQVGFPGHGIVVTGWRDGQPDPRLACCSDMSRLVQLERAVGRVLDASGTALVEVDMRAHRNPTRMNAIEAAARDLVRSYLSRCPICGRPGFEVSDSIPAAPCAHCGEPTQEGGTEILTCWGCAHHLERPASLRASGAPNTCSSCHP